MLAKASQEERMLLYRLDREVVNFPTWPMLAMSRTTWLKETPSLGTDVPDHYSEGAAV
jgi:hypothetical protein